MADLTAFSSTTFNTSRWVNNSLRDRPEEEALESYLASLAMKLHIISQDYTDQLETGEIIFFVMFVRLYMDISRLCSKSSGSRSCSSSSSDDSSRVKYYFYCRNCIVSYHIVRYDMVI